MSRVWLTVGLSTMLCACASHPPSTVAPRTVEIAVPVACRVSLQPEPNWPDTDEALRSAPGLFDRVKLLVAGRLLRVARARELNAALEACANGAGAGDSARPPR